MILMKTWLLFLIRPSALSARPVIGNGCSKPLGFVNFHLGLQIFSFTYNGRIGFLTSRLVPTGGNIGVTTVIGWFTRYALIMRRTMTKTFHKVFAFVGRGSNESQKLASYLR